MIPVASEQDWARIEAFMARKTVLRVVCPYCGAPAGRECRRADREVPVHPSRTRAACAS